MLTLRKSSDRGYADHDWLKSYHTFSFSSYQDPNHMGFRQLRVINQDYIAGGNGFGSHSHRDMEIVTYMLEGALKHEDSLGNGVVIHAGEVQRMTAGTGIVHSEINNHQQQPAQLLQIWILPDRNGLQPSYEQKFFASTEKHNQFCLIVSADGRLGSIKIHQDISIYAALIDPGTALDFQIAPGRYLWIQVVKGIVQINELAANSGDGIAVANISTITCTAQTNAEVLIFELS